jgi:ribosome-associated protein
VRDAVRDAGFSKPRIEGEENGEWIVVDCGAAVAHIMQPAIRQYYNLEEIWGEKPVRLKGPEVRKSVREGEAAASGRVAAKAPAPKSAPAKTEPKKAAPRKVTLKKAASSKAQPTAVAGEAAPARKPVRKAAPSVAGKSAPRAAGSSAAKAGSARSTPRKKPVA